MHKGERIRELQKLSDTRWSCRYVACQAVRDRFAAIVSLLTKLASESHAHRAVEARSLLLAIDANFVVTLYMMCDVFGKLQCLSSMLQASSLDLAKAVDLIDVVEDFKVARNDEVHFAHIWNDALAVCLSCEIKIVDVSSSGSEQTVSLRSRVRQLPSRLQDSIVMESVGDRPSVDNKTAFRQHAFVPVMDTLLSELTKRFDTTQCAVMRGIEALNPSSNHFADVDCMKPFAGAYRADTDDLMHELHQAKCMLERLSASKADENLGGVPGSLMTIVTYIFLVIQ